MGLPRGDVSYERSTFGITAWMMKQKMMKKKQKEKPQIRLNLDKNSLLFRSQKIIRDRDEGMHVIFKILFIEIYYLHLQSGAASYWVYIQNSMGW